MCEKKELQFTCHECGANDMRYHKYVKFMTPVSLQENGHMEYGISQYDEDDSLAILNGFACRVCGSLVEHCGFRMETERQLIDYLTMDPQVREQQQSEHDELVDAKSSEQEKHAWEAEEMSAAEKLALADWQ